MGPGYDLKERWERARPALDALDRRDLEAHLALPIGERLLRTIRLGEAAIRAHPEIRRSAGGAAEFRRSADGAAEFNRSPDGAGEFNRSPDGAGEFNRSPDGAGEILEPDDEVEVWRRVRERLHGTP